MQTDNRLDTLLSSLSKESFVTLDSLSRKLQLSPRTIRELVRQLKEVLIKKGGDIERKRNLGIRLQITDEKLYQEFIKQRAFAVLPETGKQRSEFLLIRFFEISGYQKVEDLCDMLYVSRKTLSGNLKKTEQYLNNYHLQLIRKPHYGLKVSGSEPDLRRCLKGLLQETEERWSQRIREKLKDAEEIRMLFTGSIYQSGYTIYEMDLPNIILQIQIALYRIEQGFLISQEEIRHQELLRESDIGVAQTCAYELERHFHITIPISEIRYLAIQLLGKKKIAEAANSMVIDGEINQLVNQMLESVYHAFRLDLRADFDLNTLLRRHMVSLRIRLQYRLPLENPILEEIKEVYGFPYAVAAHASTVLAEHFQMPVPKEEIGYLALCFALSLKQKDKQKQKRNILLICATGVGSAKLFEYRFREMFDEYLGEIKTGDIGLLRTVDVSRFDYVFSTVPIFDPLPIPICQVNYFFDRHNVEEVERILKNEKEKDVRKYFSDSLFFTDIKGETKEEILKEICRKIDAVKKLPGEFGEYVLKRERLMQTDFYPYIAIPHPFKPITEDTFVSIAILEKPIFWHVYDVQIVFLLSVSTKKENLENFYTMLSKFMTKEKEVQKLLQKKDFRTFMEIIGEIENK